MSRTLALLLLAALLAHGAGLRNGFVYDDHRFVAANPRLASASLLELALDPASQTADGDRDVWRPLRALGHRLDLSRGLGPFGFHLHSLLVHMVAVGAGWQLLRRLLPPPAEVPALLGALVLAVHPLGVEAVGWISSRGDLYALAFALLALLAALRADEAAGVAARAAWRTVGGVLALLAFLGKESAVWLPLVALLSTRGLGRPRPAGGLALACGIGVGLLARQAVMSGLSPVQTAPHGGSLLAQVGWALYGTGLTLGHVAWPMGLGIEYEQAAWASGPSVWVRPWTLLALAAVAATWWLRRRAPAAALLLGAALLAWLPSSSLLVTLRSLVNDRGAYPLLLPCGALLGLPLARHPRAGRALAAALALLLVPLCAARTADFHDDASLWSATLRVEPRSVRAWLGLAVVAGRSDPARQGELLERAVAVAVPGSRQAGVALAARGDWLLRTARRPDEAVAVLGQALGVLAACRDRPWPLPEEAPAASALAEALTLLGRHAEGDRVLAAALAGQPSSVALLLQRTGLALFEYERSPSAAALTLAAASWRLAAEAAPEDPLVRALGERLLRHVPPAQDAPAPVDG